MTGSNHLPYGWINGEGAFADLVFSSRLRLARNLSDYPFPHRAGESTRKEIFSKVKAAASAEELLKPLQFVDLAALTPLDRQVLVENYLISPGHVQEPQGRALLQNQDRTLSVMVNEEDHLRLQCFLSGLNLEKGWNLLTQVDDAFETHLPYAFHEQWGYLTACPTNLGTALRASALLHLPALTFLQVMPNLIHSLNQSGIVVRGFYGEGTEPQGHFYQISNASSFGPTEEDIVSRVSAIARQIIDQEIQARDQLKKEQPALVEDRVWRAFSILKSARIINSFEAMDHLSLTRVGVQMGILPQIPMGLLNELLLMTRPANLQKHLGIEPDPAKRDVLRANYLRSCLEKIS